MSLYENLEPDYSFWTQPEKYFKPSRHEGEHAAIGRFGWTEGFALRKVPTRAFAANALYLEIIRLAYNLVTAFQRTCLPEEWQGLTLSKLRHRLFWLPGELSRPENRPTLWLGNSAPIRMWKEKILHHTHKLNPLEN